MVQFKAVLKPDPTGTGTYIDVPTEVIDSLHLKGRPKIQAVIAGHPYRGSLMPIGDGSYALGVLKAIQQAEGLKHGDAIRSSSRSTLRPARSSRRPTSRSC